MPALFILNYPFSASIRLNWFMWLEWFENE